jgi:bacterioferritin
MSPQIDPGEKVLESLHEALKAELTAVHQYLLHAKICQNWGYSRLAESNRKEATEEMAHAEALMERLLYLKETPNMNDLFNIAHCNTVKEQLESDLALEKDAIARLNSAVKAAREANDDVSGQLFSRILQDEDHHVDQLEGKLHVIEEIGVANFLALHV